MLLELRGAGNTQSRVVPVRAQTLVGSCEA